MGIIVILLYIAGLITAWRTNDLNTVLLYCAFMISMTIALKSNKE